MEGHIFHSEVLLAEFGKPWLGSDIFLSPSLPPTRNYEPDAIGSQVEETQMQDLTPLALDQMARKHHPRSYAFGDATLVEDTLAKGSQMDRSSPTHQLFSNSGSPLADSSGFSGFSEAPRELADNPMETETQVEHSEDEEGSLLTTTYSPQIFVDVS